MSQKRKSTPVLLLIKYTCKSFQCEFVEYFHWAVGWCLKAIGFDHTHIQRLLWGIPQWESKTG
jgi:hypothetical protein